MHSYLSIFSDEVYPKKNEIDFPAAATENNKVQQKPTEAEHNQGNEGEIKGVFFLLFFLR